MSEDIHTISHLTKLRERADISIRELARQVGVYHTNIVYWEKTGRVAKVEALPKLAKVLGVSIEEILGEPKPKRSTLPAGKLGQVFEHASSLPRRQQQKIIDFVEPFISSYEQSQDKESVS